jgi:hypothetical protein
MRHAGRRIAASTLSPRLRISFLGLFLVTVRRCGSQGGAPIFPCSYPLLILLAGRSHAASLASHAGIRYATLRYRHSLILRAVHGRHRGTGFWGGGIHHRLAIPRPRQPRGKERLALARDLVRRGGVRRELPFLAHILCVRHQLISGVPRGARGHTHGSTRASRGVVSGDCVELCVRRTVVARLPCVQRESGKLHARTVRQQLRDRERRWRVPFKRSLTPSGPTTTNT